MRFRGTTAACCGSLLALGVAGTAWAQTSFVNWESPHVHPLDLTPDGQTLVAVNTADNRLEVYRIDGPDTLTHVGAVPVGLDPVTARARTDSEVWVVNRISDSVSVVDLDAMNVVRTIPLGDEPGDVVFAAGRAFVSVGTSDEVWVFDLPLSAVNAPTKVQIDGEDPRALGTDGETVYALIFSSGNGTTVLNHAFVTNPDINPYEGDPNPPPNLDDGFDPPINPNLPEPPKSSMILKLDEQGTWRDVNGADWSAGPFWTLHEHAMASIDAQTLAVSYTNGLMTTNTALDVNPVSGDVAVVGTHAFNHIRFEPNLRGRFIENGQAVLSPGGGGPIITPINEHLVEFLPSPVGINGVAGLNEVFGLPDDERAQTLGDPRGVAWSPDGSTRIITGRGSNSIAMTDPAGVRLGLAPVGQGPTGVHYAPSHPRAYVLNHFDGSISIVDTDAIAETTRVAFHDPTPQVIKAGRPHFYDTVKSSGLGNASCQSCHTDGAMDLLSWDLGDPSGEMKEFNQTCIGGGTICDDTDWHPMKGPMTTQTLFGTIGTEPFHWRGDREDLAAFNGAFDSLLAGPLLTDEEMAQFEGYVATLTFPPNPFRLLDGTLPTSHPNGGDPQRGEFLFITPPVGGATEPSMLDTGMGHVMLQPQLAMARGIDGGIAGGDMGGFNCNGCHALPTGTNSQILRPFIANTVTGIHHLTKVAQLRDMYRKDGFDVSIAGPMNRGTGFLHDGSYDTLRNFLAFFFGMTVQDQLDMEAFLFSLATDTHAGVGTQVTLSTNGGDTTLRDAMLGVAETGAVGLVVKGVVNGVQRGYYLLGGGIFQSDREAETVTTAILDAHTIDGAALTWTLVAAGTDERIGVDRDEDGFYDRDEIDQCADPADPDNVPGSVDPECCASVCDVDPSCCSQGWTQQCIDQAADICPPPCPADLNGDHEVNVLDLVIVILTWGVCPDGECAGDVNGDLVVDVLDLIEVILAWGAC